MRRFQKLPCKLNQGVEFQEGLGISKRSLNFNRGLGISLDLGISQHVIYAYVILMLYNAYRILTNENQALINTDQNVI